MRELLFTAIQAAGYAIVVSGAIWLMFRYTP